MNIRNESIFLNPDGIAKIEKKYNAKYVFESCLKHKDGEWANFPCAIFYTETPHPRGSNYFGLYRNDFGDIMIADGISATEPFDGLQVGDDIIYSRYRHDYREHNGGMVDGGRDYFRHNKSGTPVKLQVNKDKLDIIMTEFFFSKDREKAFDELKQALYNRLQQRRNYAAQDPLKDVYFKGLQKGALNEVDFLEKLLNLIERS